MIHEFRAHALQKSYQSRSIIKKVSFHVKSKEIVGLLGPNGAGKTTSFSMAVGLTAPDDGKVTLDGQDLTYEPIHLRASSGIGYLPQSSSIFKKLSVEDNLLAIMEVQKIPSPQKRNISLFPN